MNSGVYKIQLNNEVYIGSSIHLHERELAHRRGYQNGRGDNPKTKQMLDNGGTFEILEYINNVEEMHKRETYYIRKYKADNNYILINKFISANKCLDRINHRKEYYREHKEEINKKNKEYAESHKDEVRDYKKEWARRYRETHREEINAYKREYRKRKKEVLVV